MNHFDLPLPQLLDYRPEIKVPDDLRDFWDRTLIRSATDVEYTPVASRLHTVDVWDVTFSGDSGAPIKGWFIAPKNAPGPLPCIVEFVGYGGGRGFVHQSLEWSAFGYAHFIMDTRGQGSVWAPGHTADATDWPATPHVPGFLTLGAEHPERHYYRRVYHDAYRAVDAALNHPLVDPERLAVAGISQGGGIALATAALQPAVRAVVADVPFLSHFRRAAELATTAPYDEIVSYCHIHRDRSETLFDTLSYFDVAVLSRWSSAPALVSVALRDGVCPPSTVFAAFNAYGDESPAPVDKEIRVWEWNEHEGGQGFQRIEQIEWLAKLWG